MNDVFYYLGGSMKGEIEGDFDIVGIGVRFF